MPKPIVNNKITYQNVYGRVITHENFLDQSVRRGDSPTFANLRLTGDAYIEGNLYVEGNSTILDTNVIEFEDNIFLINRLETGSGVTLNQSGLEVERGSLENYRLVFNEADDTLRSGFISDLQAVATREDNPLLNGVMVWNDVRKRLDATNTITIDMSISSTTNSASNTSGCLKLSGGLGVIKDATIGGELSLTGSNNANKSVMYTDKVTNTFHLTTPEDIYLTPLSRVRLPFDKFLSFGTTEQSISVASADKRMTIRGYGDIFFNLEANKRISIPNLIPLTFSTQNEKIYTDGFNNMVIAGQQDIEFRPGATKKVFIPANIPLAFGDANQKVSANLLNDLTMAAGNHIYLTPGTNLDVRLPTNNFLKFGDTGSQRITSNGSNDLTIMGSNNIYLTPSSGSVQVPFARAISFGDTQQNVTGFSNGSLVVAAPTSVNLSTGTVYVSNDLTISGNFTVLGTTTILNTETVTVGDNLIVVNSGPVPLTDGGLLVKKFVSGTSGSTNYAGVLYKNSTQEFAFAYSSTDPGLIPVTIEGYVPLRAHGVTLVSTENAIGVGTGGTLTVLGGGAFSRDLHVGATLYSSHLNTVTQRITSSAPSTTSTSGALVVVGGISVACSENATSQTVGGGMTMAGGVSIGKDLYLGGDQYNYGTTYYKSGGSLIVCENNNDAKFTVELDPTTNDLSIIRNGGERSIRVDYATGQTHLGNTTESQGPSSASFVLSGGISIGSTQVATSLTSGGGITVVGGASVGKNVWIGGDVNLTSTTNASGITEGALHVAGGTGIEKQLHVGGETVLYSRLVYTENGMFETVKNTTGSSQWYYFGEITGYSDIEFSCDSASTLRFSVHIDDTTVSYGHSITDNNGGIGVVVYDDSHLFMKVDSNTTTNVRVYQQKGGRFNIVSEGTGVTPDGTTSGFTGGWVKSYDTRNSDATKKFTIGDLTVDGQHLYVADPVPMIGYNNDSVSSTRDVGLLFARYQRSNDTASGDVVSGTYNESDVLPAQISVTNTQIKLSTNANATDHYYKNWWIKVTTGSNQNQVRQIVSYNGAQRVAVIDVPWTGANPIVGDTVYLYNHSMTSMYFNEGDSRFKLAYVTNDDDTNEITLQNHADLEVDALYISDTTASTNVSMGGLISAGGISVNNTTDSVSCTSGGGFTTLGGMGVRKVLRVGDSVNIGEENDNITSSLQIAQTASTVRLEHNANSYSSIAFGERGSNLEFGMVMNSSTGIFSLTHTTNSQEPLLADKLINVSSAGNIAIGTTTFTTDLVTVGLNSYLSVDSDSGFLGIVGGMSSTSGSKVIVSGVNSVSSGSLRLYSGSSGDIQMYTSSELERLSIDQQGTVKIHATTTTTASSIGSLVVSGGLGVNCTVDSSSASAGGGLTIAGGAAIGKDLYIGGGLNVYGDVFLEESVRTPVISFSNTIGCTVVEAGNVQLCRTNDQRMLSMFISVLPDSSSQNCEVQFDLPERTTVLGYRTDVIAHCGGYSDNTELVNLYNTLCVGVVGTTRAIVKFQSVSTAMHYITLILRYTSS